MNTDWFQKLFTSGRPHRRDLKGRVGTDADGNPVFLRIDGRSAGISPDNSIDSFDIEVQTYLDCGCSARTNEIGGHCGEPGCERVMCDKCWPRCRCSDCGKPCCLAHVHYMTLPDGTRLPLCQMHHREAMRLRFWKRLGHRVLRPFVSFEEKES